MVNYNKRIGKAIAQRSEETDSVKENISPDETDQSLLINNTEFVDVTDSLSITKKYVNEDWGNSLAYYKLDKDSDLTSGGIVNSSLTPGLNATASGYTVNDGTDTNVTYVSDDPLGEGRQSADYNGSSSFTNCGNDSSLNATNKVFMCGWIKPDDSSSRMTPFGKNYKEYDFWIQNGTTLTAFYGNGSSYASSSHTFGYSTDTWYHVGIMYDKQNGEVKLYKNGVLANTNTGLTSYGAGGAAPFVIGERSVTAWENSRHFDGSIAQVRVWTETELTQSEIQAEMNSAYPVKREGLVSSWLLDGDSKDTNYLVAGKVGKGFSMTGETGNQITTPYNLDMNKTFSLSMWIKRTSTFDSVDVFSDKFNTYNGGKTMLELRYNTGIRFRYGPTGAGHVIDTYLTNENQWYHLVWIHNGWNGSYHEYSVYKDNVLIGTEQWAGEKTDTSVFDIGRAASSYKSFDIDDVRIFKYALSSEEITEIYNEGNGTDNDGVPFVLDHPVNGNIDSAKYNIDEDYTRSESVTL